MDLYSNVTEHRRGLSTALYAIYGIRSERITYTDANGTGCWAYGHTAHAVLCFYLTQQKGFDTDYRKAVRLLFVVLSLFVCIRKGFRVRCVFARINNEMKRRS
ncbi:hypothetical protein [Bacillus sp. JJ864]|uniref:hypothetical protein n=1 Tax=Bacillus sp. JJ864 TaxID=3122975 RepID=UPI002FFE1BFA